MWAPGSKISLARLKATKPGSVCHVSYLRYFECVLHVFHCEIFFINLCVFSLLHVFSWFTWFRY